MFHLPRASGRRIPSSPPQPCGASLLWCRALAAAALSLASVPLSGEDPGSYKVIVNLANPAVSMRRDELVKMYLKKTTSWPNGHRVIPLDLVESSPVRKRFSEEVLEKSIAATKAYWQHQVFSGRDVPPLEKSTGAEVVEYVRSHPDALGYVPLSESAERVKVLIIEPQNGAGGRREE